MISVEEARERILSYVSVLEPEEKPILECLGQVLAEDVVSDVDVPPADNSAMDGFAARAADTVGASEAAPRYLSVVGEVPAGRAPDCEVGEGTAVRIMTGAFVPPGADAVVQFENTDEEAQGSEGSLREVGVYRQVRVGQNIRARGEDISRGQVVLAKGKVLRAAEVGVLASVGRTVTKVVRRPRVSILSTGDELVEAGEVPGPGQIFNSNSYSIAAEVLRYGAVPRVLGVARDSIDSLNEKITEGLKADMLITCGGVSLGDYDVVKDVLAQRGEIALWTVSMKPGRPSAFGLLKDGDRRVMHLGLPGNPVSAMVTFEQFARPAILKMMGKRILDKPRVTAVMEDDVRNSDGRRIFVRVKVRKRGEEYFAHVTGPQGSGILTSMSHANGLAIVPEGTQGVRAGEKVSVEMLDWSEDCILED
ncbi:MAG: gephyrin-like molybdotransferase Glp [Chloroflexota bacterium]